MVVIAVTQVPEREVLGLHRLTRARPKEAVEVAVPGVSPRCDPPAIDVVDGAAA